MDGTTSTTGTGTPPGHGTGNGTAPDGYDWEFEQAANWLERIEFPTVVIPGNHDARNVGYLQFERRIGTERPDAEAAGMVEDGPACLGGVTAVPEGAAHQVP